LNKVERKGEIGDSCPLSRILIPKTLLILFNFKGIFSPLPYFLPRGGNP